jgi:uncharacterized protein YjiS (DUF1127 family)
MMHMLSLLTPYSIDNSRSYLGAHIVLGSGRIHETLSRRFVACLRAGIVALTEWRNSRRADHELKRLDDRILRDIGIIRAEIHLNKQIGHGHRDSTHHALAGF